MKEISEEYRSELQKKIDEKISEDSETVELAGTNLEIPKKVIKSIGKKMRTYEVESIRDMHENYETLSKLSSLPLSLIFFMAKSAFKTLRDPNFTPEKLSLNREKISQEKPGDIFKMNFNMITLDSVYINNFNFFKRNGYDLIDFNITDSYADEMKGFFCYGSKDISENILSESKQSLEDVLMTDGSVTFDIDFQILGKDLVSRVYGLEDEVGKNLLVHRITRKRGDKEDPLEPEPYVESIGGLVPSEVGRR